MRQAHSGKHFFLARPARVLGLVALASTLVACVAGVNAQPSATPVTQGSVPSPAVGEQGGQGLPGLPGAQGNDGQSGIQGLRGSQGLQGIAGPAGRPGPAGPAGERGLPGPSTPSRAVTFQHRPIFECEPGDEGAMGPTEACSVVNEILVPWRPEEVFGGSDFHVGRLTIPLTLPEGSWWVSATILAGPSDQLPFCLILSETLSLEQWSGPEIGAMSLGLIAFSQPETMEDSYARGEGHGLVTLDGDTTVYLDCLAGTAESEDDLEEFAWGAIRIDFFAVELASISYAPSLTDPES